MIITKCLSIFISNNFERMINLHLASNHVFWSSVEWENGNDHCNANRYDQLNRQKILFEFIAIREWINSLKIINGSRLSVVSRINLVLVTTMAERLILQRLQWPTLADRSFSIMWPQRCIDQLVLVLNRADALPVKLQISIN